MADRAGHAVRLPLVAGRAVDYGRIDPALPASCSSGTRSSRASGSTRHRVLPRQPRRAARPPRSSRTAPGGATCSSTTRRSSSSTTRGIPADVTSVRHFDAGGRRPAPDPGPAHPHPADCPRRRRGPARRRDFPLRWVTGPALTLDLSYAFEPGTADDGVTVDVPLALLPDLDPAEVPGAAPGITPSWSRRCCAACPRRSASELGPAPEPGADGARAPSWPSARCSTGSPRR